MKTHDKTLIRALNGHAHAIPPVWMMRQAGRYLPEYRETRGKAGDFLSLCYNPDFATEVTLQPIRRYGFDAAILFADILLVPQALGLDLWFEEGEGPRLSTIKSKADVQNLRPVSEIDETLSPIYETVRNLRTDLPNETALIGFAGSPWTVITYMIAGRGTPDQAPAKALMKEDQDCFDALMDVVTRATIHYLRQQIKAGAETVKLFDSWAGALSGMEFARYITRPATEIISALKQEFPDTPIISFPRGGTMDALENYARITQTNGIAIDSSVDRTWAAKTLQPITCVQGNLDQRLLVDGGKDLISETKSIVSAFADGPHIFNLGHGITPDADPANVQRMLDAIRG